MSTTWILVAQRAGAKVYEHSRAGGPLTLLEDMPHPEGRAKDHDVYTDRAGRTQQSSSVHQGTFAPAVSAHEEIAIMYAKELGAMLGAARARHAFDRLVLVAEPRFLGLLRGELDAPTTATVLGSVPKELDGQREDLLANNLRHLLSVRS